MIPWIYVALNIWILNIIFIDFSWKLLEHLISSLQTYEMTHHVHVDSNDNNNNNDDDNDIYITNTMYHGLSAWPQ